MLRHDVVEACRLDKFAVHAISDIHEALALFTGVEAGIRDETAEFGGYERGTLLFAAVERAHVLWTMANGADNLVKKEDAGAKQ